MNESNGQTADLYGWLNRQAEVRRQQITVLNKEIGDLEAAMAAVAARQPTPVAPQVERRQCKEKGCGGWLVPLGSVWVHERSGDIACFPGHSGPVAQPLDQTAQFPQVAHNGVAQVFPVPTADPDRFDVLNLVGQRICIRFMDDSTMCGHLEEVVFDGDKPDSLVIHHADGYESADVFRPYLYSIADIQPAEVSDQTTATPAASVTVPDEAAQS